MQIIAVKVSILYRIVPANGAYFFIRRLFYIFGYYSSNLSDMTKLFIILCILLATLSLQAQKYKGKEAPSSKPAVLPTKKPKSWRMPQAKFHKKQQVELSVRVLSNQQADAYVAVFSITQMAATLQTAKQLFQDRYDGLVQGLQSVGIPKNAVYLQMMSVKPMFTSGSMATTKTNQLSPEAVEIQQNIYIQYSKGQQLADIQYVAAQFEVYDLLKIDYQLNKQTSYLQEMQQKAIDHLLYEIELLEEKLGLDLESGYRVAAENHQLFFPQKQIQQQASVTKLSLGKEPEKGKDSAVYQPMLNYYKALNTADFDIVIHPERWQPSVQLVYHLKIQIEIKDSGQPSKEYFWLTPDGDKVPVK